MKERYSSYTRRCKYCEDLYPTTSRHGRVCEPCQAKNLRIRVLKQHKRINGGLNIRERTEFKKLKLEAKREEGIRLTLF